MFKTVVFKYIVFYHQTFFFQTIYIYILIILLDKEWIKIRKVLKCFLEVVNDFLMRFGFEIPLSEEYERIKYFGRGPGECYEDKKHSATVGLYDEKIEDMYVLYLKSQEGGSHVDSRKAEIYGKNGSVTAFSDKNFSFSLSPCKTDEYPIHIDDVKVTRSPVFNIDYRMRGIGSASCGPELLDKYKITEENISFSFDLIFC